MKVQRGVIHRARRRAPLFGEYSENRTCCAGRLSETGDGQSHSLSAVEMKICRIEVTSLYLRQTLVLPPIAAHPYPAKKRRPNKTVMAGSSLGVAAALLLSSSLGVDAFSISAAPPSGCSASSASSILVPLSATALHATSDPDQPPSSATDSLVGVYGGSVNGGTSRRRRTTGGGGNNQSRNRRNNNQGNRRRRRNDHPSQSQRADRAAEAQRRKNREQHLALRSKLEEMQRRNGQGEELLRKLLQYMHVFWKLSTHA